MRKCFVVSLPLLMTIVVGPRAIADVTFDCKDGPAQGATNSGKPSHFHITVTVGGKVYYGAESLSAGETCATVLTNIRAGMCTPVGKLTCTAVAAGPPGQAYFTVTNTPKGDPIFGSVCTDDEDLGDSYFSSPDKRASAGANVEVQAELVGVEFADGESITVDVGIEGGDVISTTVDTTGKTGEGIRQDLLLAMEANGLVVSVESPTPTCEPCDLPNVLERIVVSGDVDGNPPKSAEFYGTDPSVKGCLSFVGDSPIPTGAQASFSSRRLSRPEARRRLSRVVSSQR